MVQITLGGTSIELLLGENTKLAALKAAEANTYASSASAAQAAAEESASFAEEFSGPVYANTSAGVAATAVGQFFRVSNGDTPRTYSRYERTSTTPFYVLAAPLVTSTQLNAGPYLAKSFGFTPQLTDSGTIAANDAAMEAYLDTMAAATAQGLAGQSLATVQGSMLEGIFGRIAVSGNFVLDSALCRRWNLRGLGLGQTAFSVTTSNYLFRATGVHSSVNMSDFAVFGGKGLILFESDQTARVSYIFERLALWDFTECGIGSLAQDHPEIKIRDNLFCAANSANAIGIALAGWTDNCTIERNNFIRYKIGIKIGRSAMGARVLNNGFNINATRTTDNLVDLWVVPTSTSTNSGDRFYAGMNRYNAENRQDGDYNFLCANEDTGVGTNFANMHTPSFSNTANNFVSGVMIDDHFAPASGRTTPLYASAINNFSIEARPQNRAQIGKLLGFVGGAASNPLFQSVVWQPEAYGSTAAAPTSDAGIILDSTGVGATENSAMFYGGGLVRQVSWCHLTADWTFSGSVSGTDVSGAVVGIQATRLNFTTDTAAAINPNIASLRGRAWAQGFIRAVGGSGMTGVRMRVTDNAGTTIYQEVALPLTTEGATFCVPVRVTGTGIKMRFLPFTGETGTMDAMQCGIAVGNSPAKLGHNGDYGATGYKWNTAHGLEGSRHVWYDTSGNKRCKNGVPSSATDGTIVSAAAVA